MTFAGDSGAGPRPLPAATDPGPDAPMTMALATQMLPLVTRIAADLRVAWETWRTAVTRYDTVVAALDAELESPLARRARREAAARASDIDALRQELAPLRATCRSPRSGRVEWDTVVDGIPARLLWQPGEATVSRWEGRDVDVELGHEEPDTGDPSRP